MSTEAKDIRMSDIEILLGEYKTLVYMTENLLNERTTLQNNAEKKTLKMKKDELNRKLAQVSNVLNESKDA